MTRETIEAGSEEAVQLVVKKARELCQTVHDRFERQRRAKANPKSSHFDRAHPSLGDITRFVHSLEDALQRLDHGAPQPERVPYKVETKKRYAADGELREEHESFGVISFHRISGQVRLFGSHLDNHPTFIRMEVRRCEMNHGLGSDTYFPVGPVLISVDMSAAQYAEAITTMNMGGGIPCTIRDVVGIRMENVPEEAEQEHRKIRADFRRKLKDMLTNVQEARKQAEDLVENHKSVSKGRARELASIIGRVEQEVRSNMPFALRTFEESADRVVTAAKAEVESFAMSALIKLGGEEFARRMTPGILGNTPMLTDGKKVVEATGEEE